MKIELTAHEVGLIVIDFLAKRNGLYEKGRFDLEWKIAAATGQPSFLVGAEVSMVEAARPKQDDGKEE